ncbi:MAG: hypothetical protein A2Y91_02850 [Chloroflexi bacterium RBG_13_54_8]|nr:MAG: hypothetical protein A2Y91_02850 [Chloroflexi bacterium RBG_13_54_8]
MRLQGWANCRSQAEEPEDSPISQKVRMDGRRPDGEKYSVWPEAKLPALHGSQCNHPWAQALSAIAHATGAIR